MKHCAIINGEYRGLKDKAYEMRRAKAYMAGLLGTVRVFGPSDFVFELEAYNKGLADDKIAREHLAKARQEDKRS